MTKFTTSFSRRAMTALLLGGSLGCAGQAASAQAVAANDIAPGEIVITARNRVEKLQDVPLTVTAVSGEQIAKTGIRDLKDIATRTPGLIINGSGSESLTRPSIRGLPSTGGDPTVAIFYDGAFLFNPASNNIALMDIDRVEVVKGPVNSLYGRAAYAGAINYISKTPVNHFEGRVLAGFGNDGQYRGQAVVNLPVIKDVFALRVSGNFEKYGGGWKDQVNGLKQGGFQKRDGQVSWLWNVSSKVTATGRVYYGNDKFDMNPISYMEPNCGIPSNSFAPFQHLNYTCGRYVGQPFQVLPQSQEPGVTGNSRKMWNGFAKLNFDMGFGDLTSLTTYTNIKQQRFQDFVGRRAGLPFALQTTASVIAAGPAALNAPPIVGTINLPVFFGNVQNDQDIAQELRFQSKADKPVRLTGGVYVAKLIDYQKTIISIDGRTIPAGFTITGNPTTCALFVCDRIFLVNGTTPSNAVTIGRTTSTIWSGFGGVEADPVTGLTVSVDGRYTSDRRDLDSIVSNSGFTINNALGSVNYISRPARSTVNPTGAPVHKEFNYFSGRASIRYKIDPTKMVYATVANGVKVGGFNARSTHIEEQAYGNEKNITYEAGLKTEFFNRMLQFNLSGFYIKIKNIQANGPSQFADTAGLITTNVGGATSKGFELDGQLTPTKWLTLSSGIGLSDATFDKGSYDFGGLVSASPAVPSGFALTCQQVGPANCDQSRIVQVGSTQGNRWAYDLKGLRVQASSKWTASLGADVNIPVSDEVTLFAGAKYRYQSRQFTGTQNLVWWAPLNRIDVRVGVERGPLRVTAFVDNLNNNRTPDSVGLSSNLNDLAFIYQYAALPFLRRFGATAEFKF